MPFETSTDSSHNSMRITNKRVASTGTPMQRPSKMAAPTVLCSLGGGAKRLLPPVDGLIQEQLNGMDCEREQDEDMVMKDAVSSSTRLLLDGCESARTVIRGYAEVSSLSENEEEKVNSNNGYVTYRIDVECGSSGDTNNNNKLKKTGSWSIYRRYSHFRTLVFRLYQASPELQRSLRELPSRSSLGMRGTGNSKPLLARELCQWLSNTTSVWREVASRPTNQGHAGAAVFVSLVADFLTDQSGVSPLGPVDTFVPVAPVTGPMIDLQNLNPNMSPRSATQVLEQQAKRIKSRKRIPRCLSDFILERSIGQGSFGQVFVARDCFKSRSRVAGAAVTGLSVSNSGRNIAHNTVSATSCKNSDGAIVAIKVMSKAEMVRRNQSLRVNIERQCMGMCDSPFIAGLVGAFANHSHIYLVQEFCEAGEMYFHLNLHGKFEPKVARFFAAECGLALAHMHAKGIVFRDLKPENIMICRDGHVKLVDFGLSTTNVHEPHRGSLSFVGTMEYFSPEMIRKQGHGFAVDWWSLGMVLYEMLTGLPPWYSENRKLVMKLICESPLTFPDRQVSASARSLLRGLLEKDPRTRLGSRGGIGEVESHPYFSALCFKKLLAKRIKSPYTLKLESSTDTAYFAKEFTDLPVKVRRDTLDPANDAKIIRFADAQGHFDGFTPTEYEL